jgi:uncharacterized NAD(P)/FAD-binding protein YdhS
VDSETTGKTQVVIIGGGFTGTMIAAHLIKGANRPMVIDHVEPRAKIGLGLAYSTNCDEHILNVRAKGMSAFPSCPNHFIEFAVSKNAKYGPESFVPRKIYGEYLRAILEASLKDAAVRGVKYNVHQDEAVNVEAVSPASSKSEQSSAGANYVVALKSGITISATHVVLAAGNLPGKLLAQVPKTLVERGAYIHDPWRNNAIAEIGNDETVMLIGTGLTAVDKIVELLSQGHRGNIIAISRHGWLPRAHVEPAAPPLDPPADTDLPVRALATIQFVRRLIAESGDWRQAVDSLRRSTQAWWQALPNREKALVEKHLQSIWDVHRHRMAPQIFNLIQSAMRSKQLVIVGGRVKSISDDNGSPVVTMVRRGAKEKESIKLDRVVNCTGFGSKLTNRDSILFANLVRNGLVVPDSTGVATDMSGKVLTEQGQARLGLYAAGAVLKPQLFETVAVPELRDQAANVAGLILDSIGGRAGNSTCKEPEEQSWLLNRST